eukprot:TRINITY_DN867_c0_g1_i2.p1 TRINITY_DN867_c0_g1~~TRINITY_DN867_c0_g1_i2.p1  ORF type:complete len:479 (+),score=66.16 TRINITY_DN867_c0_g1_i2:1631-3067(+)
MNDLTELQFNSDYATLFGFTKKEIVETNPTMSQLIEHIKEKYPDCEEEMQKMYNGYSFSLKDPSVKVYNPLAVLSYLRASKIWECLSFIGAQGEPLTTDWVSTGTSTATYLSLEKYPDERVKLLEEYTLALDDLTGSFVAHGFAEPATSEICMKKLALMLLFSGYLTIEKYDESKKEVYLKPTNSETKKAITKHLKESMKGSFDLMDYMLSDINFTKLLEEGRYTEYFEAIGKGFLLAKEKERSERFFQNWLYMAHHKTLHERCLAEYSGSIQPKYHVDLVCELENCIVLMELKEVCQKSLAKTMRQFYESNFVEVNKTKPLILIALRFNKITVYDAAVYVIEVNGAEIFEAFMKKTGDVTMDCICVYPEGTKINFGKDTANAEETKSEEKKKRRCRKKSVKTEKEKSEEKTEKWNKQKGKEITTAYTKAKENVELAENEAQEENEGEEEFLAGEQKGTKEGNSDGENESKQDQHLIT